MSTSPFTIADKVILQKKLQYEVQRHNWWSKFSGIAEITPDEKGGKNYKLSGSPIEVFTDFKEQGRDHLILPMLRSLQAAPKIGNQRLAGASEDPNFFWMKVFTHFLRHGVNLPTKVEQQLINWAATYKEYEPLLAQYWAKYENHDVTRAFLEGFSKHLTDATNVEGKGITKRYHKNFLFNAAASASLSQATFSYTSSTYKSALISAMGTLASATTATFTTTTLEALIPMISLLGIEPWYVDGEPIYPLVINTLQAKTLKGDSAWKSAQNQLGQTDKTNPIFNGAIGKWGGILIFVNDNVARIAYATGSTLDFFNYSAGTLVTSDTNISQYWTPAATGTNQHVACGLLLGKGSLAKGIAEEMTYTRQIDDHEMVKEIGAEMNYAYQRNDFYNEEIDGSTAPTAMAQPQSAVICTYVA